MKKEREELNWNQLPKDKNYPNLVECIVINFIDTNHSK